MRVLAIGAHPDDIEYGCGGTLLKLSLTSENKIFLLIMTKGEKGGSPRIRWSEQSQVAKKLGAKFFWGGFSDTKIPLKHQTIQVIEKFIQKIKPEVIFVHHPDDTHQDHKNVSLATITATRYLKNVLFFEVPTTINFQPATVFVDITDILPAKLELLKLHQSQVYATRIAGLSILEAAQATAIFRGFQYRVKYAEGFVPHRMNLGI